MEKCSTSIFCIVFFLFFSSNCKNMEKGFSIRPFPDPWLSALKGEQVHTLICLNSADDKAIDTTWFDQSKNVIKKKSTNGVDVFHYDSLGFPISILKIDILGDTLMNVTISNRIQAATNEVIAEYENKDKDVGSYIITYKLNDDGYVIQEVDKQTQQQTNFVYDSSSRFLSSQITSLKDGRSFGRIDVQYDDDGYFAKIIDSRYGETKVHHFTGGKIYKTVLNESTVYKYERIQN